MPRNFAGEPFFLYAAKLCIYLIDKESGFSGVIHKISVFLRQM